MPAMPAEGDEVALLLSNTTVSTSNNRTLALTLMCPVQTLAGVHCLPSSTSNDGREEGAGILSICLHHHPPASPTKQPTSSDCNRLATSRMSFLTDFRAGGF